MTFANIRRAVWPPEQLLALAGDEHSQNIGTKTFAFVAILLFHYMARNLADFLAYGFEFRFYLAAGFLCCFLAFLHKKLRLTSIIVATVLATYQFVHVFPLNPNHFFLEYVAMVFVALAYLSKEEEESQTVLVQGVKWLIILVFLLSGIQKLMHGTYFRGVYLSQMVAMSTRSDHFWQYVLPTAEFAALKEVGKSGPFLFYSPFAILLSNLVYITQIGFAALLLHPKTRMLGALAILLLLIGIEYIAKEYMFGLFVINALLLYVPARKHMLAIPAFITVYALLICARLGFFFLQFN